MWATQNPAENLFTVALLSNLTFQANLPAGDGAKILLPRAVKPPDREMLHHPGASQVHRHPGAWHDELIHHPGAWGPIGCPLELLPPGSWMMDISLKAWSMRRWTSEDEEKVHLNQSRNINPRDWIFLMRPTCVILNIPTTFIT